MYRLILTAVLVATKFYNDIFYGNNFIAYLGGVHLKEINRLEVEFLRLINFKLMIEHSEYIMYY
jgi:hypothetical protein